MRPQEANRRILDASRDMREALEAWTATDLDAIARCQSLIRRAAADLQQVISWGASPVAEEGKRAISDLRGDIRRMLRLVDACDAFEQGLRLALGDAGREYGAAGPVECGATQVSQEFKA